MKTHAGTRIALSVLLLVCSSAACGETSTNDPQYSSGSMAGSLAQTSGSTAGASGSTGGATAGASASAGGASGATSCPAQTPINGTACQGMLSCPYWAFIGCYPSSVQATCKDGLWNVPAPIPYSGPCPGQAPPCPTQLPTPGLGCGMTLDGPPAMLHCEYPDPTCVGPRIATCSGSWTISECVPVAAGGAGGESAGGAANAGAGGAE